jgi:hypothetical protein
MLWPSTSCGFTGGDERHIRILCQTPESSMTIARRHGQSAYSRDAAPDAEMGRVGALERVLSSSRR